MFSPFRLWNLIVRYYGKVQEKVKSMEKRMIQTFTIVATLLLNKPLLT